jgi:hypothetical protein
MRKSSRRAKKQRFSNIETTISGDTRADWSEAFELAPSIQIAYVWHASVFTREVLNGLLRIGFLYPEQIIWNKGRTVLTRTHYGINMSPAGTPGRRTRPGLGKRARTPRCGIRLLRSSSWADRTKRSRPPHAKACRFDAPPDPKPRQARPTGL